MVVSDVHYEHKVFRGVDESRAWEWLLSRVDEHAPDVILSGGDWGDAARPREWDELLSRAAVLTIYGNHDSLMVLKSLRNYREPLLGVEVLMKEGKLYLPPLRAAGIHGIVSRRRRGRGTPRRVPGEVLAAARRLAGAGVGVLLIHEAPFMPWVYPGIRGSEGALEALKAVELVAAPLTVNGHMHFGYRRAQTPWGGVFVHVDTSLHSRHYLTLELAGDTLEARAWRDGVQVDRFTVELTPRG